MIDSIPLSEVSLPDVDDLFGVVLPSTPDVIVRPNDADLRRAYLAALAKYGLENEAARGVGLSQQKLRRWLEKDELFRRHSSRALNMFRESVIAEIRRRGMDGVEKLKFHDGEPIKVENPETGERENYVEREYGDRLLLALAGVVDERFRTREVKNEIKQETTVTVGPSAQQVLIELHADPDFIAFAQHRIENEYARTLVTPGSLVSSRPTG